MSILSFPPKAAQLNRRTVLAFLIGASAAIIAAPAEGKRRRRRRGHDGEDEDYDEALKEVNARKAAPLSEIVEEVQKVVPGEVLEVELKRNDGTLIYFLTILSNSGTYFVVTVDARDKTILKIQEK